MSTVDIPFSKLLDQRVADLGVGYSRLPKECPPNLHLGRDAQLGEVQSDMNAGEKGFIIRRDAIRGEKEDTAVVLDMAQAGKMSDTGGVRPKRNRRTRLLPKHYAQGRGKSDVPRKHPPSSWFEISVQKFVSGRMTYLVDEHDGLPACRNVKHSL